MKRRGPKTKIKWALKNVEREISGQSQGLTGRDRFYAAGLASEGYAGGYRDALMDVELVLNGVTPNRRHWWDEHYWDS